MAQVERALIDQQGGGRRKREHLGLNASWFCAILEVSLFGKAKFQDTMRFEFMELRDVEISLGVQFPELFHTINSSGMMDYLSHSREWVKDKIENDMNYAWREDFFGEWMGDCWLFAFEDLPSAYDELYECLNFDLKIYPERQSISPLYRLVPFAHRISGDKYCFLYEDGKGEKEPKIVVYGHDTGDVGLWATNFEEFVYFQIVEEAADKGRKIHSDYIKAHIQWLNDAHKRLLAETPIKDIWEQLPEPQELYIWTCCENSGLTGDFTKR